MKTTPFLCAGAAVLVALSAGCASRAKTPVYDTSQTGQILREKPGEVIAVRDVIIKPPDISVIRGGTGAQVGAAAGSAIMTGSIGVMKGAIGAAVGRDIGGKLDEKAGEEIEIRLDGDD